MQAKKKYGQNFLKNDTIINKIVSLFNLKENDFVIEIGPGMGALTKKLLSFNTVCIEIDDDMHKYLDKYESDKCHIIYDDILQTDLKKVVSNYTYDNLVIVGNLPYYITSPILSKIIKSNIFPDRMFFMVQKEVAERFSALPKTKEYGYMTLFLNYYYKVTKELNVSKYEFNPVPKVDSAIIKLERIDNNYNIDTEKYFEFLKKAFQFKRKTLKNNLNEYDFNIISKVLTKHNLDLNVRPEEINQDVFIDIFSSLF